MSEDARRTTDWDWIIRELESAKQLDVDEETLLMVEAQLAYYEILRGEISDDRLDELSSRVIALDDFDLAATGYDLRGLSASLKGDWRPAVEGSQRVIEISPLNAQYALPRLGQVAVMAADATTARHALQQIADLGVRGRAVSADVQAIQAGIAALEGDSLAAQAGFRAAIAAWRELGLEIDEAMTTLAAATYLDPADPEVAGWVDAARATFAKVRARPLEELLEQAVASAGRGKPTAARSIPVEEQAAT
jgi:tetratricopeptide (TPR) repeat protein